MLKIQNFSVKIEGKTLLKEINLEFQPGKIYGILGPNGSGKSTLARSVAGDTKYQTTGNLYLDSQEITSLSPDKRSALGLFVTFQNPPNIDGVKIAEFIKVVKRHKAKINNQRRPTASQILQELKENCKKLDLPPDFYKLELNTNLSGGQKKKLEILQLLSFKPKYIILDEIDSGLDIDALRVVSKILKTYLEKDMILIIISHYPEIFEHLKPDQIVLLKNQKVEQTGDKNLLEKVKSKGFNP